MEPTRTITCTRGSALPAEMNARAYDICKREDLSVDVNVLDANKTERCGVQNSAATNTSLVEVLVRIDMKTRKKKYIVAIERE